ncbi:Eco57I restriction-modification methylase domain-containing protein [Natronorubrum daqingense]|uniref:site-specific DNA-methyltransferase (adenine-specific) n=1 Tax=Natronorubrum daqingense TaxID=588898 RepID=A0A1N7EPL8_9EURY|nr:TaqI-like C-terminal specificity domain-containing protein [Natronorubrum daqingense]APX97817.1 restriction endonuclease [Natronorubrum daqingense]SIR90004.1 N-6 DNA Methylase [Natronorubrum daqingense]
MSQATLSDRPYANSNLFSGHYLDERIQDREEWDCDGDAEEAMAALQSLYDLESGLVEGYKEDPLIDNWIDEVLDVLGFGTNVETTLPDGGGYVDVLLFDDPEARRDAAEVYLSTEESSDLFERGIGLVEAKQWDADFSARFSEQRPYRNASHQIKHYLERTPESIQWGVLTNGRKWRLYGTKDYETQTYYEVDLPELLERGDLEAFKYFYLFFRPAAFQASGGTTFLDSVRSESETVAQELGEDLQDNVFTAVRVLGRGFVETNDLAIDPDDEKRLGELKEQSLVLLYRLMFVLYAESRGLIHPKGQDAVSEYEDNFSLDELRLEIHEEIGEVDDGFDTYSEYSTTMWSRLEDLFRLVDEGEESLGIPPYNGGLFNTEKHGFLTDHEVSNRYLAEVIYRISTTENDEGRYVLADYADLDTRHLGSVYEGLLEHQFRIAPADYAAVTDDGGEIWKPATEVSVAEAVETVDEGGLYVVNDEGERKATGAYYTPDYVVTYIVEETVDPLIDEIRTDLQEQGFEPGTHEYLGAFYRRVLDLKVLDPAMGSGHFLTRATEYLAQQVMEEVREIEEATAFDEQRVRRDVAKECIYGVDLNGMAVELAKLSMWLETLAADQPLAFLDHHLKAGNSLVGSDVTDVLSSDTESNDGQLTLQQALARVRQDTLEHVMERMQELLEIDNETLEDIKSMEELYDEVRADPFYQRLFELTNVHTAERFDLDVPEGAYERMARAIDDEDEWLEVREEGWFKSAQAMCTEEAFFHWELEYPEVFFDEDGEKREDAGFDVVIGNPPWVSNWELTESSDQIVSTLESLYPEVTSGHWDLFVPFCYRAATLARTEGRHSFITPTSLGTEKYGTKIRKKFVDDWTIHQLVHFGEHQIFSEVDRQYLIYMLSTENNENCKTKLTKFNDPGFAATARIPQANFSEYSNYSLRPSLATTDVELKKKVDKESIPTGRICCVNVGVVAHAASDSELDFKKDDVISQDPQDGYKQYVEGSNISRYLINWEGEYIDYESKKSHFHRPKYSELFESEKIVIPRVSGADNRIEASFDKNGYYNNDNVTNVVPWTDKILDKQSPKNFDPLNDTEAFSLYSISGVLNSNLITYYFSQFLATGTLQGSYSSIYPDDIRKIPIHSDLSEDSDLVTELTRSVEKIIQFRETENSLNLALLDHLGSYSNEVSVSEVGFIQPTEGAADSILTDTAEDRENLRVGTVEIERQSPDSLEIHLTARYKPENEDEYETDRWGYTETDPEPALEISDLTETEADLIEAFVPVAVDEAGGFANFRETATKNDSLVDRLRKLTLPAVDDVRDGLESYLKTKARAEELEAKIEKTDELIDEIVYELYGLTEEEIEIVEEAVEK